MALSYRLRVALLILLIGGLTSAASPLPDVDLGRGISAHFVSVPEGAEILGRRDEFVQRLSPFDRSARMKTDRAVSEEEFLEFVRASVLQWTTSEEETIRGAIERIRPALEQLALPLPKKISFVKTSGAEEGQAFYTRDTAIVLPAKQIATATGNTLDKTIAHELFHILSRANPALREKLYDIIGFKLCPEVELPPALRSRKITNPDAPRNDHYIELRAAGKEVNAVPILFSKSEKYDPVRGGEFFEYLQFQFLPLPHKEENFASSPLLAPNEVGGFFEKVGRNTDYVIHPEEILADNFALLVLNERNPPSPKILEKMRNVLSAAMPQPNESR